MVAVTAAGAAIAELFFFLWCFAGTVVTAKAALATKPAAKTRAIARKTMKRNSAEDRNPEEPGAHGVANEFRGAAGKFILALSTLPVNRFV